MEGLEIMVESDLEDGELIESFENTIAQFNPLPPLTKQSESFQRQKRPRPEEKTKKNKCKYWGTGTCYRGQDCPYVHDGIKEDELCKYILTDSCIKGDKCVYSHDTQKFPCKFLNTLGICQAGDTCKFSHAQMSPTMVHKFVQDNEQFLMRVQHTIGYPPEMYQMDGIPSLLPYPMAQYHMWHYAPSKPPSPDLASKLHACGIIKVKSIPMPPPELVKKRSIPDRKQIFKPF